jgi:hypothetical protein
MAQGWQPKSVGIAMSLNHAEQARCFSSETDVCLTNTKCTDLRRQAGIAGFELSGSHSCHSAVRQAETDFSLGVGSNYVGQVERLLCSENNGQTLRTTLPDHGLDGLEACNTVRFVDDNNVADSVGYGWKVLYAQQKRGENESSS